MKARYIKPESVRLLEQLCFEQLKSKCDSFPTQYINRPSYRDDTTNDLTSCVIKWICLHNGQAERINSTGRKLNNRMIFGSGTKGTADISATIFGKSVKIEIKCEATGDRYQSEHQKRYQMQVERAGGIYIVVRNFTQFVEWYQQNFDGHGR